ncbi:MAG: aminotransferase class I/II-fold pyridoxal phosphate-dependent enzyme [Flavobacteriales bacterium]|nr:aminotransferase class I/II-fold pyridoxal phosphate-dependent enzyme [Flavobacteriales bacterium]
MSAVPSSILRKLKEREDVHAYRTLRAPVPGCADFSSNDYLGINHHHLLRASPDLPSGSTGSRLLTGHSRLAEGLEEQIAAFHGNEAALLFNAGYMANLALLSTCPQRNDTVIYDEKCHASIRDGIRLGVAKAHAFRHQDMDHLADRLRKATGQAYVVVESIYSMDGDLAPLKELVSICDSYQACLIVDEAHACGLKGEKGEGRVHAEGLSGQVFAVIYTYGKAFGCSGASIVTSKVVREYLINFARPFIYTTAMPPVNLDLIRQSYDHVAGMRAERSHVEKLSRNLYQALSDLNAGMVLGGEGPLVSLIVEGTSLVRALSSGLMDRQIDARAMMHPTVAKGEERIRFCLHAFNTEEELSELVLAVKSVRESLFSETKA